MDSTLQQELTALKHRIDSIEQPPATTLEILDLEESEQRWEELLLYFLRPTESHGFGTAVLETFLDAVASYSETILLTESADLSDVRVQSQVPAGDGFVDLLLWLPDDWFLCIELKAKSPESGAQTKEYAAADKLGKISVDDFPTKEYVYLASETADEPSSDRFKHLAWESIVDHFDQADITDQTEYPRKSRAQFADYLDTIRRTLNMGEFTELSEESEAYITHSDAIERAVKAYRKDRKRIFNQIRDEFYESQGLNRSDWDSNIGTRQSRIDLYKYIQIYKKGWRGGDFGSKIEYEIHALFTEEYPKFSVRLDVESDDDNEIREKLDEDLDEEIKNELQANRWVLDISGSEYWYLRKEIEFTPKESRGSTHRIVSELEDLHQIIGQDVDSLVADASRT